MILDQDEKNVIWDSSEIYALFSIQRNFEEVDLANFEYQEVFGEESPQKYMDIWPKVESGGEIRYVVQNGDVESEINIYLSDPNQSVSNDGTPVLEVESINHSRSGYLETFSCGEVVSSDDVSEIDFADELQEIAAQAATHALASGQDEGEYGSTEHALTD